jgi:hypothetical protein
LSRLDKHHHRPAAEQQRSERETRELVQRLYEEEQLRLRLETEQATRQTDQQRAEQQERLRLERERVQHDKQVNSLRAKALMAAAAIRIGVADAQPAAQPVSPISSRPTISAPPRPEYDQPDEPVAARKDPPIDSRKNRDQVQEPPPPDHPDPFVKVDKTTGRDQERREPPPPISPYR